MRLLKASDKDFSSQLEALLASRQQKTEQISSVVGEIISRIRKNGDEALFEYTEKFDNFPISATTIRVSSAEIDEAYAACSPDLIAALQTAARRIRLYSEKQLPADLEYVDDCGVTLGHRWSAIDAVGIYVPGGTAAYPSSVLMNAIPAIIAGCSRVAMVAPTPHGLVNKAVLAAARIAGIDEIYKIGGAQAIAALAYGTATIKKVDKIAGPGNAYVTEAKRQLFGEVGIDMIAGPSEILIIADSSANPAWLAADLLSQAEHDKLAQAIIITTDAEILRRVNYEINLALPKLPRAEIAGAALENYGASLLVDNIEQACAIANIIAPEHLELMVENPRQLLPLIKNAGAVFLGGYTPEAIGDYIAGPSHVLPTSGTARFSSGLSVFEFLKRSSLIDCSQSAYNSLYQHGEIIAAAEGLEAHKQALAIRNNIA